MLDAYEATPEPSVLLACSACEPVHALAFILEGFGYTAFECKGIEEVNNVLSENFPCIALVCAEQKDIKEICDLINQREDLFLLVLIEKENEDPDSKAKELGAFDWIYIDTQPEKILIKLRKILELQSP